MEPYDLDLPYQRWQPQQWEIIARLAASEKKYIFLEAPTGIGKSGIIKGYANLMDYRFLVCTGTKQLQDQYRDSLALVDVRGRANFKCPIEPVNADQASCTLAAPCSVKTRTTHKWMPPENHENCDVCTGQDETTCSYYDQNFRGQVASQVVLNYAFWLHMTNYAGSFKGRSLTVFDECQTLEDEVRRFAEVNFSRDQAMALGLEIPWFEPDDIESWQEWVKNSRILLHREYTNMVQDKTTPTDDAEANHRRRLMSFWSSSGMFLAVGPKSWVGQQHEIRGVMTGRTDFKPVWIAPLMNRLVLRHTGEKVIFMSGTILDKKIFSEQLGLGPELERGEIDFIQVPSTFEKSRRPLYYQPGPMIRWRDHRSVRDGIARIDEIIDKYPDQKGIIHTVSHALAGFITHNSRHKARMIGHETRDKAYQLEFFKRSSHGIWVSPSSGTGVDLPYDMCEWQIISKLPFPDKGDKQIKQLMKEDDTGRPTPSASRWYNWVTLCQLIQMYGRGMRAPDDRCDTYLLDENWRWFRAATRDMQPAWFRQAIINPPPESLPPLETRDSIMAELEKLGVKST